jgi:cytoskeleton protein RodZ
MSNSDDVVDVASNFGSLLAQAREEKNYTVEEVYRHIKIPVNLIMAIEASDVDALPESIYTLGYLRSYAKLLEISESSVVELYNKVAINDQNAELKQHKSVKDEAHKQTPLIRSLTSFVAVMAIIAVIVGIFQYYQEKSEDMETALESKEDGFTGDSLDSPGKNIVEIKQDAHITSDGELILGSSDTVKDIADQSAADAGQELDTSSDSEENTEALANEATEDVLKITAANGAWVEVRDVNNARLLYNMLPEGGRRVLLGNAPFNVFFGNAETTKLTINGIEVELAKHIRSNNTVRVKISSEEETVVFH